MGRLCAQALSEHFQASSLIPYHLTMSRENSLQYSFPFLTLRWQLQVLGFLGALTLEHYLRTICSTPCPLIRYNPYLTYLP
jgi:hypothetical protein